MELTLEQDSFYYYICIDGNRIIRAETGERAFVIMREYKNKLNEVKK